MSRHLYECARQPEPHQPRASGLEWAAPGSLFLDEVATALQHRGLAGLRTITGPWAIAFREAGSPDTILAVDPIGVAPLFWTRTADGRVLAAALLATLADHPEVDDSLDYDGVLVYSALDVYGRESRTKTPFAAIQKLPGGHALRVAPDGTTRLERYWDPAALHGTREDVRLPEAAELLRTTIDAAVRRLLSTEGAVGAHLSGGLDSSAIACRADQVLREEHGRRLVAGYSWAPDEAHVPGFDGDERTLLAEIAAREGFPIRTLAEDEDAEWWWRLDPTRYPEETHWREVLTLRQARADGVQVMLSGWGGDELASFNGAGVLGQMVRQGRWATVWREGSQRMSTRATAPVSITRKARRFAGVALGELPGDITAIRHPRQARIERRHAAGIDAAIRQVSPWGADLRRRLYRAATKVGDPHERMVNALTDGHLQHRTACWYQTGDLMGVEYRYPLLDLDVVRTALSLPWEAYLSQGWDRVAFRLAVEPWVTPAIAWNLTKDEPALFSPARATPSGATTPPGRRALPRTDARYEQVLAAAALTWNPEPNPEPGPDRGPGPNAGPDTNPRERSVRSRPDLAPRRT